MKVSVCAALVLPTGIDEKLVLPAVPAATGVLEVLPVACTALRCAATCACADSEESTTAEARQVSQVNILFSREQNEDERRKGKTDDVHILDDPRPTQLSAETSVPASVVTS
jgi:hypothetical protein